MSEAVDKVKNDLKELLQDMTRGTHMYTLIEKCVKEFYHASSRSVATNGGWQSELVWIPYGVSPTEGRDIIISTVLPTLQEARALVASGAAYHGVAYKRVIEAL